MQHHEIREKWVVIKYEQYSRSFTTYIVNWLHRTSAWSAQTACTRYGNQPVFTKYISPIMNHSELGCFDPASFICMVCLMLTQCFINLLHNGVKSDWHLYISWYTICFCWSSPCPCFILGFLHLLIKSWHQVLKTEGFWKVLLRWSAKNILHCS